MEKGTYNLLHEILLAMNGKYTISEIFSDLEKVSDCVNHNILFEKLKFYGIKDTFFTLVKSYLEGRYQIVIIANSTSNYNTSSYWNEIKCRVPQSSIRGPLIF